jgi:DNA-binding MarR family transcriptional regulator
MKIYPKKSSPCACLNLRRAAKAITIYYDCCLQSTGITVPQMVLLRHVNFYKSVTMTDLAKTMRIDRTTLNRNLKPLVAQGFLEITRGEDSRTREIHLLEEGEHKLQEAMPLWEQAQQDIRDYLGQEDAKKLTELVAKIEALVP